MLQKTGFSQCRKIFKKFYLTDFDYAPIFSLSRTAQRGPVERQTAAKFWRLENVRTVKIDRKRPLGSV